MATGETTDIFRQVRRAVLRHAGAERTDGQLLESFLSRRDPAALELLVRRHAPMVWGVCRRTLPNHHDAEDAFQATFLVLVRRAASIAAPELLANWLYGVARQTARKARAMAGRRRGRERQVAELPEPAVAEPAVWGDLQPLLDREMSGLPDKYRAVIVLCDLEGNSRSAVARQLGLPEGTVASRLTRGRALLAKRLARQGLALSAAALAEALSRQAASAAVPMAVVNSASAAVVAAAALPALPVLFSPQVAALSEGVVKAMVIKKVRVATAVLLSAGLLTFSAGTLLVPSAVGTAVAGGEDKAAPKSRPVDTERSRTVQVRVVGPAGMTVGVLSTGQAPALTATAPVRLGLARGGVYRLKLSDIRNRPGVELFPTIEVAADDRETNRFMTSSAVPVTFTDDDFDRVLDGTLVTKVVYLAARAKGQKPDGEPDQPVTIASYEAPDVDAVSEARRRGTILAVVRMGNVDGDAAAKPRPASRRSSRPAGKAVEAEIGDDGTAGRVLRWVAEDARAAEKERRADQLAHQLEVLNRELAAVQAENAALRERLKGLEVQVRALQAAVDRRQQESNETKAGEKK